MTPGSRILSQVRKKKGEGRSQSRRKRTSDRRSPREDEGDEAREADEGDEGEEARKTRWQMKNGHEKGEEKGRVGYGRITQGTSRTARRKTIAGRREKQTHL